VASTSRAAEMAADEPESAAIGSAMAAEIYGVPILFANIEDNPNNITRFFVIAKEASKPSGDDKTAIMFTTEHKAGALTDVLDVFRDHGLNLTHIDKRPSKRVNWEYYFFVDFLGHAGDPAVQKALDDARKHCLQLTVLGSFPRAREVL
jgi:chorismate mutase/prephenate dehydratase